MFLIIGGRLGRCLTKIAECDALLNEVSSKKDTWVALLKEAVKLEVKTTDELAEVVV